MINGSAMPTVENIQDLWMYQPRERVVRISFFKAMLMLIVQMFWRL